MLHKSFTKNLLAKLYFSPDSKIKLGWDILVIITAIFTSIDITRRIALDYSLNSLFILFDLVVTIIFTLDIIFNFFTPIKVNRQYISSPKKLANAYLRGTFLLDLLAALPMDMILSQLWGQQDMSVMYFSFFRYLRFLRLIKIFRLVRLSYLMKKWDYMHVLNPSTIRLTFFIFWLAILSHWIACGWLIIYHEGVQYDRLAHYLRALYWTITTLTTVGYGDIVPKTNLQLSYTMITMLLGVGVYGYVIGNMATLVANLDLGKAKYMKKMETLNTFFQARHIPHTLRKKITDYYTYLWESELGDDHEAILTELPQSLKVALSVYLNQNIIQKVPLFHGATPNLIKEVALELKSFFYAPGDIVTQKGDIGDAMFLLSKGVVELLEDENTVFSELQAGSFFGEMSLVLSRPRMFTIRAKDYCDIYVLNREAFDKVSLNHPSFKKQVNQVVNARLEKNLNKEKK